MKYTLHSSAMTTPHAMTIHILHSNTVTKISNNKIKLTPAFTVNST